MTMPVMNVRVVRMGMYVTVKLLAAGFFDWVPARISRDISSSRRLPKRNPLACEPYCLPDSMRSAPVQCTKTLLLR